MTHFELTNFVCERDNQVKKKKISVNLKSNNKNIKCLKPLSDFEIRDKRIGIIFKVIYVVAAISTTLFIYIQRDMSGNNAIVYAGILSFLFWILLNLLFYVFNELKCLKIGSDSIDQRQFTTTEDSYSFIFTYFHVGVYIHLVLILTTGIVGSHLTDSVVKVVILLSIVIASVVYNIRSKNKAIKIIAFSLYSTASYFTLYLLISTH